MKRISLLFFAVIGCQAADVVADTLTVNGASTFYGPEPTSVSAGEVKIGGGYVKSPHRMSVGPFGPAPGLGGSIIYRNDSGNLQYYLGLHGGINEKSFILYDYLTNSVNWLVNANGTMTFYGNAPSAVAANQVAIGGGVMRSSVTSGCNVVLEKPTGASIQFTESNVNGYQVSGSPTHDLVFYSGSGTERLRFTNAGEVMVYGAAPTTIADGQIRMGGGRMMVGGTISAKEIKVTTTGADYVFEDGYILRSLAEVEQFIAREKRLPEMMPARQMQAEGMPVSEVVTKQLAKIEELTLYAIGADSRIKALQSDRDAAHVEVQDLKLRLERLEKVIAGR